MVSKRTHLAIGAAVGMVLAPSPVGILWSVPAAMFSATLPDVLEGKLFKHRRETHTLLAVLVLSIVVYLMHYALSGMLALYTSIPLWMAAPVLAGYMSHLLADMLTAHGLTPLYPLVSWRMWLLPKRLRISTSTWGDTLLCWLACGFTLLLLLSDFL